MTPRFNIYKYFEEIAKTETYYPFPDRDTLPIPRAENHYPCIKTITTKHSRPNNRKYLGNLRQNLESCRAIYNPGLKSMGHSGDFHRAKNMKWKILLFVVLGIFSYVSISSILLS
jgi:hypothetical protein